MQNINFNIINIFLQFIDSIKIQHIINVYKSKIIENPNLKVKEMVKIISKETGLGQNTIQSTIFNYKNKGSVPVKLPNKKKVRRTVEEKIDNFEKETIRQIVKNFRLNHEVPTLNKILNAINEDPDLVDVSISRSSLHRLLKSMHLVYTKRSYNTDTSDIDSD